MMAEKPEQRAMLHAFSLFLLLCLCMRSTALDSV